MKKEVAEKLAATEVDGLTVTDARLVIKRFLAELILCPVCNDAGVFVFPRRLNVPVIRGYGGTPEQYTVDAGTTSECPSCNGKGTGDPAWVQWVCEADNQPCRADYPSDKEVHAPCGWRLVLTLDVVRSVE